jgi:DNA repair exonuclease SbcCD ATPase subunit
MEEVRLVKGGMSEKRRIVIRRKVSPEELQVESVEQAQKPPEAVEESEVTETTPASLYEQAAASFAGLRQRLEEIRSWDRAYQRIFKARDDVRIEVVKKRLDKLIDMRNQVLTEAQNVENLINEALGRLETEMAVLEEELFDKLVEAEYLRDRGGYLPPESQSRLESLEKEIDSYRQRIVETKKKLTELQHMLDKLRELPRTIHEETTSVEEAEPLYKDLVAKFRDEVKIRSTIDKIMQEQGIPRPYAIIHVWKAAFKPKVSGGSEF